MAGLSTVGVRLARIVRTASPPTDNAGAGEARFPALRRFARDHFNPRLLKVATSLGIDFPTIVHHRGRRSAKPYATPVVCFRINGGYLIPLTYGPETDWVRNILAAGGCELERRGERHRVGAPRVVALDEAKVSVPAVFATGWSLMGIQDVLLLEPAADTTNPGSGA